MFTTPPVGGDLAGVDPVVEHAHAQEERPGDKAVGDHLHHAAGDAEHPAAGGRVLGEDGEDDEYT